MTESDTVEPQTAADPDHAYPGVIALPCISGGWTGRYLRHAPGPGATARLLRQIVTTRYRGTRPRHAHAAAYLLDAHPGGWAHLGPGPGKRFTTASPLGRCLCHEPGGAMVPAMEAAALATVLRVEHNWKHKPVRMPSAANPPDGGPWLLGGHNRPVPVDVAHVFILRSDGLEIQARDTPRHDRFAHAALVPWSGKVDWDQVDRDAAAIRARTTADVRAEATAAILKEAAQRLSVVREHLDLVGLYIDRAAHDGYHGSLTVTAMTALARHVQVPDQDLPRYLAGLVRADQVQLLQEAADALVRGVHPAP